MSVEVQIKTVTTITTPKANILSLQPPDTDDEQTWLAFETCFESNKQILY